MDIEEQIKKAKEIGYDEIPNPKSVQAEKLILEVLNSKPTRCFKSNELNELLRYDGIRTPSSGTLTRLADENKIEQVKLGLYRAKLQSTPVGSLLEKIRSVFNKITTYLKEYADSN